MKFKKQLRLNVISKLILSLVLCLFGSLIIQPQEATGPKNTITVLPQLTQLDLSVDKPEATIYYTNNASFSVELDLSVEDVRELEDRNPVGILDPKEAANYKYSLSSWVYLNHQTIILNPGETGNVKVTINKDKLSPGGHYGSILAEIRQSEADSKVVKIKGVLASLLFVRASTGNEIESAKLAYFGPSTGTLQFPDEFDFSFQNTGNVDATPYGLLVVKDSNGAIVAKGVVNEDSSITLPESIRKYVIPLKQTQKFILPGKYTAFLSLHYGKQNKKLTSENTFSTLGNTDFIFRGFWAVLFVLALLLLLKFNGIKYIIRNAYDIFKGSSGD